MTRNEFISDVVAKRLQLITDTLARKGNEYSADGTAFHNFEHGCTIAFAKNREVYAWDLMCKHLQSIKDMIDTVSISNAHNLPTEVTIEEKIGDAINYLILIEGMLKENIKNAKTT